MAGKTLKKSVKSTAARKAEKLATANTDSKPKKDKLLKLTKSLKKELSNADSSIKTKNDSAKPSSKQKAASEAKSKAVSAKKDASSTILKTTKSAVKPAKTSSAPLAKKASKMDSSKADAAPKSEVKKTAKPKKSEKTDANKKTKTAKSAQAQDVVKPQKKNDPVKASAGKLNETVNKKIVNELPVSKPAVKKQEEPVQEPDQNSKPKAKRATKFMTKGNAAIIAQLRLQLLQRRKEIISSFWGDLDTASVSSQASGDTADAATDSVHSEMRSQLAEKESQELSSIDYALHKMETGEYGLCEECGMPIAVERLEVIPDAELCLKCQEELEEDGEYDSYSYYRYD